MRTFLTAIFLLVAGVLTSVVCQAQTTYEFTYDDNGNRETRAVIFLKNATINPDDLEAKKTIIPQEDQIGLQKTLIYPNPTKGLLRLEFPELTEQGATIRVFDPNGKMIVQKSAISSGNEVDLSAHPPGFYIMVIHIGQEKKEWKIIKE